MLATSLGDLTGDAVQRASLPVQQVGYVPAGTEQAYVLLDRGGTRTLFDAMIEGSRVPAELTTGGNEPAVDSAAEDPAAVVAEEAPAEAAPAAPEALTVPPSAVAVDVLNGTGTTGLAATVADLLRGAGLHGGRGRQRGRDGQRERRPLRPERRSSRPARWPRRCPGPCCSRATRSADTVQLVIGPGYSTVVPVEIGAPPADGTLPEPEAAPTTAAPAPVTCG